MAWHADFGRAQGVPRACPGLSWAVLGWPGLGLGWLGLAGLGLGWG